MKVEELEAEYIMGNSSSETQDAELLIQWDTFEYRFFNLYIFHSMTYLISFIIMFSYKQVGLWL